MTGSDAFCGWPSGWHRAGFCLLVVVLSALTLIAFAGAAGYVWVRWLA